MPQPFRFLNVSSLMYVITEQPVEFFETKSEKLAKTYYQSCVRIEKEQFHTDAHSRKALIQILDLIGGWPAIDGSYVKMNWDFQEAFETVHNVLHVEGFLRWVVEPTPPLPIKSFMKDRRQYVIKVRAF